MKKQQTLMLTQTNAKNAKIDKMQSQIENLEVENVLDSKNIIENSIAPSVFRFKVKLNRLKDMFVYELNEIRDSFFLREKSVCNPKFCRYDFVGVRCSTTESIRQMNSFLILICLFY